MVIVIGLLAKLRRLKMSNCELRGVLDVAGVKRVKTVSCVAEGA